MKIWLPLLATLVAIASAGLLTPLVRRWALRGALDIPNARSLHSAPVPRAGGLAIALTVLGLEAWLGLAGILEGVWLWPVWWTTLALAAVGFRDDLRSLGAHWRLLAQAVSCGGCAWVLVPPDGIATGLLLAGQSLAMIWLVNLYNFMDGSDGLASAQAVLVGGLGGGLAWQAGAEGVGLCALLTAGASLGFLRWNWHPARIFLGDVGSYFLGGQFAVLALVEQSGRGMGPVWAILLGPFIVDATLTLLRRVLRGERWYAPHRTHAYQRLVQAGLSPARVTLAFCGVVLGWCAPLALIAVRWPDRGLWCVLLAWALPGALWFAVIRKTEPGQG